MELQIVIKIYFQVYFSVNEGFYDYLSKRWILEYQILALHYCWNFNPLSTSVALI